jgi:hypothetical protein
VTHGAIKRRVGGEQHISHRIIQREEGRVGSLY